MNSGVLYQASQRIRKPIEEVLGGGVLFNKRCISSESLDMFTMAAVSIKSSANENENQLRSTPFNLVLGPSGSGKTAFAIKGLPRYLLKADDTTTVFTVHFMAEEANDLVSTLNISFPEAVVKFVEQRIAEDFSEKGLGQEALSINLCLHVVIDEAGDERFTTYFDEATKIDKIKSAIDKNNQYKFQRGLILTVAGTGLDKITAGIASVIEANKFRMQPWTLEQFKALVRASKHCDTKFVMQTVERFPIIQDLTTNGRCAVILLLVLKKHSVIRKYNSMHYASIIVSNVAEGYVASNGLRNLSETTRKWSVVKAVFAELDDATRQPNVAFFPKYEQLREQKLRSVATSLLDVNVESSGGHPELVNNNTYSLSISSALVIVLASLLNAEAGITWDWQGFESIAALNELKNMVVKSSKIPNDLDGLIVELQNPVPAAGKRSLVPYVNDCMVVLNGPRSGYADVIAPYRLVQAKFSIDASSSKYLDLQKELDKMGLTKSSEYKKQQQLTRLFYSMWGNNEAIPSAVVSRYNNSVNKGYRLACFPVNILNSFQFFEKPATIKFTEVNKTENKFTFVGVQEGALIKNFTTDQPVTAVFATNCAQIKLKGAKVVIRPSDVDWDGSFSSDNLPPDIVASLKDNVKISFLFF